MRTARSCQACAALAVGRDLQQALSHQRVFAMLLIAGTAVFVIFLNREHQSIDTLLYVQSASLRSNLPITLEDISAPDWSTQLFRKIDTVKELGFVVVIADQNGNIFDHSSTELDSLPQQEGYTASAPCGAAPL